MTKGRKKDKEPQRREGKEKEDDLSVTDQGEGKFKGIRQIVQTSPTLEKGNTALAQKKSSKPES